MDSNQKKIIVVDDMASMRSVIKACLSKMGYDDLDEAADGQAALDLVQQTQFDLIICDWDMPKMTGLELVEIMKKTPELEAIPFLMLTANATRSHVEKAVSAGVDDYINKPFQPATFSQKILTLLERTSVVIV